MGDVVWHKEGMSYGQGFAWPALATRSAASTTVKIRVALMAPEVGALFAVHATTAA
jgi:hypothetical protein